MLANINRNHEGYICEYLKMISKKKFNSQNEKEVTGFS